MQAARLAYWAAIGITAVSRHSGIDGGFSGKQLLSNFVRGETTFFQHSTILFEKRTGG